MCCSLWGPKKSGTTEQLNNETCNKKSREARTVTAKLDSAMILDRKEDARRGTVGFRESLVFSPITRVVSTWVFASSVLLLHIL